MRERAGRFGIAVAVAAAFAISLAGGVSAASQWAIVAGVVGAAGDTPGLLDATTCTGTTCWAVGSAEADMAHPTPPLIMSNSGDGWTVATVQGPASVNTFNRLNAITCVDAGDCWAVGVGDNGTTLIERYVNGAWAYQPSPNPDGTEPDLFGVSCADLTHCWAVGSYQLADNSSQTLIEQYDGTAWTIVGSPNSGNSVSNILNGIACPGAHDCWAVGGAQSDTPLVEHYDGAAWVIDANLSPSGPASGLQGVTCVSSSDCWGVGMHGTSYDSATQSLIEHYDGATWEAVSSPDPLGAPSGENYLYGVTCDSSSECWAVGHSDYFVGAGWGRSLVERYAASTGWTVAGPDPALSGEWFLGIGCGSSVCVAVGGDTVDIGVLIAETPLPPPSEGTVTGTSGNPPSAVGGSKAVAAPVPDTGAGAVSPWPLLLVGGGTVSAVLARRMRRGNGRAS